MASLKKWITRSGLSLVTVDFDSPAGQNFVQRNRVLSIPTTFVRQRNVVYGRIEGFDDTASYMKQLETIVTSGSTPREVPEHDASTLERARHRILLGEVDKGLGLAAQILEEGTAREKNAAALLIARYYLRVSREFDRGITVLEDRYAELGEEVSGSIMYWLAQGLSRRDGAEVALQRLKDWEKVGGGLQAQRIRGVFMHRNGLHTYELSELLADLVRKIPEHASIHFLLAHDYKRRGQSEDARKSALRALELSPERAQFIKFVRELTREGSLN